MEHRHGERYTLRQPVYLQTRDSIIAAGWLTDVSLSGGCVITHRPMMLGVPLQLRLPSGDRTALGKRRFSVGAQIVRVTQYGWALEWDEWAPQLLARLGLSRRPAEASVVGKGRRRYYR